MCLELFHGNPSQSFCLFWLVCYIQKTRNSIVHHTCMLSSCIAVFWLANHGLCGSNKLLYKRCAKLMGRPKFQLPQLPYFSTDLNETWNQERYPEYDPTSKIRLTGDDGKGVCTKSAFLVTFVFFPFFVFWPSPPGHTLSLIHIWRCRRIERCRSRWSPYH